MSLLSQIQNYGHSLFGDQLGDLLLGDLVVGCAGRTIVVYYSHYDFLGQNFPQILGDWVSQTFLTYNRRDQKYYQIYSECNYL